MTTTYSPFFASGLLAPQHEYSPPKSSSLPRADDGRRSATPTPATTNTSAQSKKQLNLTISTTKPDPRPRLGRRRSSLSVNASGVSPLKSPTRTASTAFQRHSLLLSPTLSAAAVGGAPLNGVGSTLGKGRSRAGSVSSAFNNASENLSFVGRLKATGEGGASVPLNVRPRRRVLRTPTAPPPTAPLPAIPPVPALPGASLLLPACVPTPQVRPLLERRVNSTDNRHSLSVFPLHQQTNFGNVFGGATPTSEGMQTCPSSPGYLPGDTPFDEEMKEN